MFPFTVAQDWLACSLRMAAAMTRLQQAWLAQMSAPWSATTAIAAAPEKPAPRRARGGRGRA
jgi:hypothetical protein